MVSKLVVELVVEDVKQLLRISVEVDKELPPRVDHFINRGLKERSRKGGNKG